MATTIEWPLTLPQVFLQDSYTETMPDNLIKTPNNIGPDKRRPRSTHAYKMITGSFHLTTAQKGAFENFYKTTIAFASLTFLFPNYDQIVEAFLDSYSIKPRSGNYWVLTITIKILI